jgi:hypothetical protein
LATRITPGTLVRGAPFDSIADLFLSPPCKEGLGVGAAEELGGFRPNLLGGTHRVGEHARVPKAEDSPAFALEERRASLMPIGSVPDRYGAACGEPWMARYARQPTPFPSLAGRGEKKV